MERGDILGKGRTAEVIYWDNNRVLKLFYKASSREMIEYQYKVDSIIGNIFPNCPKAFEKIEKDGRIGIIYEFIEGIILNDFMGRKIKKIGAGMKMLAELHADMHQYEIRDIDTQEKVFEEAINKTDLLTDTQKEKIVKYLKTLPKGNTICHGDLHPENILVSEERLYAIDWSNVYAGNPNGDAARTLYVLKYGLAPSDESLIRKSFLHRFLYFTIKSLVAKTYIKRYIKIRNTTFKEIKKWNLAIFAARLHEPVPLEYKKLLKMINKLI